MACTCVLTYGQEVISILMTPLPVKTLQTENEALKDATEKVHSHCDDNVNGKFSVKNGLHWIQ